MALYCSELRTLNCSLCLQSVQNLLAIPPKGWILLTSSLVVLRSLQQYNLAIVNLSSLYLFSCLGCLPLGILGMPIMITQKILT